MKNSEFYKSSQDRAFAFREFCKHCGNGEGETINESCRVGKCVECQMNWLDSESEGVHKVYNGTKISIFGWSIPVVIDLTGCRTLDENLCDLLTTSDDNEHANNLGKCRIVIGADGIYAKTDRAKATGYSVGVEVETAKRVDEGYREINGQAIFAPFYHVTKSVLKEIMELSDENKVRLTTKSDEVIELEKKVADLEREKCELKTKFEREWSYAKKLELDISVMKDQIPKLVEAAIREATERHQEFRERNRINRKYNRQ